MHDTKPLSDAQRRLLAAAADRPGHLVLPLPPDVAVRGAVRKSLLTGLLQTGLAEEIPAADPASAWRTDESGRAVALRVTSQGLSAIGRTPAVIRRKARTRRAPAATASEQQIAELPPLARTEAMGSAFGEPQAQAQQDAAADRHPCGKLGKVLASLSTDGGATLAELVALTGWQPHTTRAALTRLRRRGYPLERLELNGRTAYRIGTAG